MTIPDFYGLLNVDERDNEVPDFYSKVPEKPSRWKSLAAAPIKGLIKGAAKFSPLPSFGPVSQKLGEKLTEQFLPTEKEAPEEILEFAGENLPLAALGEGGLAAKGLSALGAGLAKKAAKTAQLPEWAQEIAAGAGMLAPGAVGGALSKTLKPSKAQAAVVEYLKSKGLSDKAITPIIQDKTKLKFLNHAAQKYEEKDPFIRGIKDQLGNLFEDIRAAGKEGSALSGQALKKFETDFYEKLEKVPRMYRKAIKSEVEDLFSQPINFTELHDFSKAVNALTKGMEGGKAVLQILKEPIQKAQQKMNPSLFKDLQLTNEAYSKISHFTDKMTTPGWNYLIKQGQIGAAITGVLTMNPLILKSVLGTAGTKYFVKQLLTNPRLQRMHAKLMEAALKRKGPLMSKLLHEIIRETKKNQKD